MVLRSLTRLAAAPRVPLIKFRKGGGAVQAAPAGAAAAANQAASNAIEDWELPPRYWRKPLDAAEMEYINRGGPA